MIYKIKNIFGKIWNSPGFILTAGIIGGGIYSLPLAISSFKNILIFILYLFLFGFLIGYFYWVSVRFFANFKEPRLYCPKCGFHKSISDAIREQNMNANNNDRIEQDQDLNSLMYKNAEYERAEYTIGNNTPFNFHCDRCGTLLIPESVETHKERSDTFFITRIYLGKTGRVILLLSLVAYVIFTLIFYSYYYVSTLSAWSYKANKLDDIGDIFLFSIIVLVIISGIIVAYSYKKSNKTLENLYYSELLHNNIEKLEKIDKSYNDFLAKWSSNQQANNFKINNFNEINNFIKSNLEIILKFDIREFDEQNIQHNLIKDIEKKNRKWRKIFRNALRHIEIDNRWIPAINNIIGSQDLGNILDQINYSFDFNTNSRNSSIHTNNDNNLTRININNLKLGMIADNQYLFKDLLISIFAEIHDILDANLHTIKRSRFDKRIIFHIIWTLINNIRMPYDINEFVANSIRALDANNNYENPDVNDTITELRQNFENIQDLLRLLRIYQDQSVQEYIKNMLNIIFYNWLFTIKIVDIFRRVGFDTDKKSVVDEIYSTLNSGKFLGKLFFNRSENTIENNNFKESYFGISYYLNKFINNIESQNIDPILNRIIEPINYDLNDANINTEHTRKNKGLQNHHLNWIKKIQWPRRNNEIQGINIKSFNQFKKANNFGATAVIFMRILLFLSCLLIIDIFFYISVKSDNFSSQVWGNVVIIETMVFALIVYFNTEIIQKRLDKKRNQIFQYFEPYFNLLDIIYVFYKINNNSTFMSLIEENPQRLENKINKLVQYKRQLEKIGVNTKPKLNEKINKISIAIYIFAIITISIIIFGASIKQANIGNFLIGNYPNEIMQAFKSSITPTSLFDKTGTFIFAFTTTSAYSLLKHKSFKKASVKSITKNVWKDIATGVGIVFILYFIYIFFVDFALIGNGFDSNYNIFKNSVLPLGLPFKIGNTTYISLVYILENQGLLLMIISSLMIIFTIQTALDVYFGTLDETISKLFCKNKKIGGQNNIQTQSSNQTQNNNQTQYTRRWTVIFNFSKTILKYLSIGFVAALIYRSWSLNNLTFDASIFMDIAGLLCATFFIVIIPTMMYFNLKSS